MLLCAFVTDYITRASTSEETQESSKNAKLIYS